MNVFTSGRDYRPPARFATHLPPDVQYVRVLVAGATRLEAVEQLQGNDLERYVTTLREPTSLDGPAAAVAAELDADQHGVFVLTVTRTANDGRRYIAPRFHVWQVNGRQLVLMGRVRVVARTQPPDASSVVRVVADDDCDDAVPMPPENEVFPGKVGVVEGVLPFPAGRLGEAARNVDRELTEELRKMIQRVEATIHEIESARVAGDPTYAWLRDSSSLLAMASDMAKLAGGAQMVEMILRTGTD